MLSRSVLLAVGLLACAPRTRILVGNVVTLDPARPRAKAVAIRDGRIIAVGSVAEVRAAAGPGAATVDLSAATVLPGLSDAHGHLLSLGRKIHELDVSGASSYDDLVRRAQDRARSLSPGAWLLGRGWDETRWGGELPTHEALSRAIPDRPVYLRRVDGHAALANARALALAGIGPATPDPEGGRILRGPGGVPTGILVDRAMDLVQPPPHTDAEVRQLLRDAAIRCAAAGLTQVHDMGVEPRTLAALRELEASGDLPIRVVVYQWVPEEKALEGVVPPDPTPGGDWRVLVRGVKIILDGAMGSRGAALLDPYADAPEGRGLLLWTEDALRRAVRRLARLRLQPAVHAIGDRAARIAFGAFSGWPDELLPPRIEHVQLLPPEGERLLARRRVVASMQPTHATSDMRWAEARLGRERLLRAYAWRRVLASGATLAFGSDFPVEEVNPLLGVYAAETRQDLQGQPAGGWLAGERLTREEALRAFTEGAAAAAGLRPELGRIAVGARADLSVFDRDVSRVPAADLLRARVLRTFVGGEEVRVP
jgi:hypothetical protein